MLNPGNINFSPECTQFCHSKQHALSILATISKRAVSDIQIGSYLTNLCSNFWKVEDDTGKTALHMAAACGRSKLSLWLIKCGSNVNKRDLESGWSPVHMAAYRGHIYTLTCLIKAGGKLNLADNNGLTPLDLISLAVFDTNPSVTKLKLKDYDPSLLQPYVWGSNSNFNLGIGTDLSRKNPDVLDHLKSCSIKQVAMADKHSILLSDDVAWACGIGRDGRLGNGSEVPVLTPVQIPLPRNVTGPLSAATVSDTHTLILVSGGMVLAFGSNSHGQLGTSLGLKMSSSPRIVGRGGPMEKCEIVGVCVGKYHSVMYSQKDLFVCGLNVGQLGLPAGNGDQCITTVTQVPLKFKGDNIDIVATCVGATVVSMNNGEVYFLQNYITRKISQKLFGGAKQIVLSGGQLSPALSPHPQDQSSELIVIVLNLLGFIYWLEPESLNAIRLSVDVRPGICFNHIALANNKLYVISNFQEAYQGALVKHCNKNLSKPVIKITLEKIPNIYRGITISVDTKARNFAVIQVDPIAVVKFFPSIGCSKLQKDLLCLLEEASTDDSLHDVVFKVAGVAFPCHKFILSLKGSLLYSLACKEKTIEISDASPQIFKLLLIYLYTGDLQLTNLPNCLSVSGDPIKDLTSLCARYKIKCLLKQLSHMKFIGGEIQVAEDFDLCFPPNKFSRHDGSQLYDVALLSEDGVPIQAHRCILTARCDYFRSMLLGGWVESGSDKALKLPFASTILEDLVDFMYTEEAPSSVNPENLKHVVWLLMAADQLMISNLQEACEKTLADSLTLKNVISLLELSETYYTKQLNRTVIEFYCMNIMIFIESGNINLLDEELLIKISDHFRSLTNTSCRDTATWSDAPSDEEVISCPEIQWPESLGIKDFQMDHATVKAHAKARKRIQKKSNSYSAEGDTPTKLTDHIDSCNNEVELEKEQLVPEENQVLETPSNEDIISLWDTKSYPSLADQHNFQKLSKHAGTAKTPRKVKYSKKLLNMDDLDNVLVPPPETKPTVAKSWAAIPPLPAQPLENKSSSVLSTSSSDDFNRIIESQKASRSHLAHMKTKCFRMTQIEEQAIVELGMFYNIDSEFEENISIHRLLPVDVDQPQWVKQSRKSIAS